MRFGEYFYYLYGSSFGVVLLVFISMLGGIVNMLILIRELMYIWYISNFKVIDLEIWRREGKK